MGMRVPGGLRVGLLWVICIRLHFRLGFYKLRIAIGRIRVRCCSRGSRRPRNFDNGVGPGGLFVGRGGLPVPGTRVPRNPSWVHSLVSFVLVPYVLKVKHLAHQKELTCPHHHSTPGAETHYSHLKTPKKVKPTKAELQKTQLAEESPEMFGRERRQVAPARKTPAALAACSDVEEGFLF